MKVLAILLFVVVVVIGILSVDQVTVKEEFRIRNENIFFLEGNQNIYFFTKYPIDDPIDLRIKDNWTHLTYLTDYDVTRGRKVFINYMFNNDEQYNFQIADNGLIFTYKTTRLMMLRGKK